MWWHWLGYIAIGLAALGIVALGVAGLLLTRACPEPEGQPYADRRWPSRAAGPRHRKVS